MIGSGPAPELSQYAHPREAARRGLKERALGALEGGRRERVLTTALSEKMQGNRFLERM